MPRILTIELDEARAAQMEHMAARMRISPEETVKLAVNLVIADWKEQWPELEAFEAPVSAPGGRHLPH